MATSVTGVGADWSCDASSFSHIFISTSSSGDACYLGITSNDCKISSGKHTVVNIFFRKIVQFWSSLINEKNGTIVLIRQA